MLEVIFNSGYELFMHGRFRGPNNKVEKKIHELLGPSRRHNSKNIWWEFALPQTRGLDMFVNTNNNNSRDAELCWTCTFPLIIAGNYTTSGETCIPNSM